ncbi:MAG: Xaa-Pro peptidase family protein [Thaumarchaeota archaeon]|nr:Xaa-Pro peptidase family protein [Nitrososphaerota archaeon]
MLLNKERAHSYMAEHNLRALLVASPTNVSYFTGFDCWLYKKYRENMLVLGAPPLQKEQFAVLPADGEPILIMDTYSSLYASEGDVAIQCYGNTIPAIEKASGTKKELAHTKYFKRALGAQKPTPAAAVIEALRKSGIQAGKIGIEKAEFRADTFKEIQKAFPKIQFLDSSELLGFIRMVKTDEEKDRLKKAAEINEDALFQSLEKARDGKKMGKLAQEYLSLVSEKGAIFDHYFYSPDGLYLSAAPNYRLRRGEYTIIDSGCTYELYYGDMGTSLLVGERRKDVIQRYRDIWDTIEELADRVQPGTTPSEVMDLFEKLYAKKGIKDADYQGHGIGLEPREYPIMGRGGAKSVADEIVEQDTDIPLEPDMVISLETSLYEFGLGSYEVERTYVVGKRSLKPITSDRDRSIVICP